MWYAFLLCGLLSANCVQWVGDTIYDFGALRKGEERTCTFSFKNCGSTPLIIDNVRPSCGCTIPDYPQGAIAPGALGSIKVTFTARNSGPFQRLIKVYLHGQPKAEKLYVEGKVD